MKLLDLFFPPRCAFCRRISREGICPACEKSLPWRELPEEERPGIGSLCAPLWYEGSVRKALLRFKFYHKTGAADGFGALVAQCAAESFGGRFELVTYVPVSAKRKAERGYDQAQLLAHAAAKRWETQEVALLRKCVDNAPQSSLSTSEERRANVLGVYEPVDPARICGKRILLVDDICTTGATLHECVRVLRDAGAADVVSVTLAAGREKRDPKKRA